VRFAYLKPGEAEARVREVAPLALVQHQGRWHLHALEPGTEVTKTFLLRRIVTQVTTTGTTFPAPRGDQTARALDELDKVWESHTADVEVVTDSDAATFQQPGRAATRLLKRRGTVLLPSGALRLHYSDANIFADELAGYGPEALVLSPPVLREAVHTRLLRTVAEHTPQNDAPEETIHG
jgi:proteasome accessory factor B